MGLKAKVWYWGYGFGIWLGSGFRVCFLLEIDYREEHRKNTNNEKKIE